MVVRSLRTKFDKWRVILNVILKNDKHWCGLFQMEIIYEAPMFLVFKLLVFCWTGNLA